MSKAPRNSGQPRHTRVAWAGFAAGLMIVTLIGLRPLGWISTGTDCMVEKTGKTRNSSWRPGRRLAPAASGAA